MPTRGRTEITLCLSPTPTNRSVSRCSTAAPSISQEKTVTAAEQMSGKIFLFIFTVDAQELVGNDQILLSYMDSFQRNFLTLWSNH